MTVARRKIIQIQTVVHSTHVDVYALCSDGSLWRKDDAADWVQVDTTTALESKLTYNV